MYPAALAAALRQVGVDASTGSELGLAGRSGPDVFEAAAANRSAILTENVSDFVRLASEAVGAGKHHSGVLIALSSRFSRHKEGIRSLVAAITAASVEVLDDRIVYLEQRR
jgi:predicted nuclease of predicted toxin-antitoxin system